MDKKTIFVKTQQGADELKSKAGHLFGDVKRVLVLVDNKSTVEELTKRAAPSLRASFAEILKGLVEGGYLHEKGQEGAPKAATTPSAAPKASSLKMAMPGVQPQDSGEELDFTSILPKITPQAMAAEAAKAKAQVPPPAEKPAKTFAQAESQKEIEARQEAEARRHAEIETARMQAGQEAARKQAQLAAEQAKAKAQAEGKALTDAEIARIKAEQEAARIKAEQIAAMAKEKEEAEAKARAEAEAARIKAEQEAARVKAELAAVQAKAQAESQARAEAESARLKAEQEAAKARAEAAQAATQAKIQAEMQALAAAQAKAEAQPKAEAQEQAARAKEADARARLQAEQEAAQAKEQLEKTAQQAAAQAAALEKAKEKEKEQAKEKARAEAEAEARKKLQAGAAAKETAPTSQAVVAKLQQDKALKAEEEARQLAQSQARKWAEAEQRAKAQAQQAETAQPVMPKSEKIAPAKTPDKTIARARKEPRQPLPLGKISGSLLVLALVLAFILPYVWPMQEYITQIERNLSAQLKQPVSIGRMRPGLLPLPKLELQNVVIGKGNELHAGNVVLNFSIASLFSETMPIKRAEISELTLKAESFGTALSAIQAVAATANFPVSQMVIHKARLSGIELNLPALSGEVFFDGKGHLIKSILGSEDGKFTLQLQPQQSRWQVSAVIKENSLPLMPGIMFNELNIKGEVSTNEANFSVIEGMLYKGKLLGSARLTWKSGWQLLGQLNIKTLAVQEIWPQSGLNGDMNGRANVTLRSVSLPLLFKSPHVDGNFSIQKGFINGIDMVETARVGKRQGVSAGRTHFDELNGTLLADGDNVQLRQIKISAGILSGNGFVDVASGNQVSGRLNVDLKIRADMGSMPLTLSGTLQQPVWRTGP